MAKRFYLMFLILCTGYIGSAQSLSLDHFEVYTKLAHPRTNGNFSFNPDSILARINSIPDTASTTPTFVISVSDPAVVDSIFLILTDSRSLNSYTGALKLSTLQGTPGFRQNGKTIYVSVGPYPYLKRFSASIKAKSILGQYTDVSSFVKN